MRRESSQEFPRLHRYGRRDEPAAYYHPRHTSGPHTRYPTVMKTLLATLGFAALVGPGLALAQETAQPPTAAQMQSRMAEFQAVHQKMEQIHAQGRAQLLAALSPAHKAALANYIGQMAVATNPNPEVTARQIDALRDQMRSVMEQARTEMGRGGPPPGAHPQERAPDAGHILLMLAMPGGPGMMHGGPHPPM
jgi:hypothetical protein